MSFQIQRITEKKKTQFSNEDGSSPLSQIEDQEIDQQGLIFGDIVKNYERNKKKKPTISSLLKSSPKKVNPPDIIKLSLDKKKCSQLFEEDKLFEFSQRSLNPTQYRNYKKKQQQNGSPTPTPKKHSNKVMPEPIKVQNGNNNNEMSASVQPQQRNSNPQVLSPYVIASIIKLQQQQETRVSQLDKLGLDQFLSQAMLNQHINSSIKRDLKIALERKLIHPHHYRQLFLVGTNAQVIMLQNKGYYQALLKQKSHYPLKYFDKIKLDVCRSFGSLQSDQKAIYEKSLDNILCAIAIRNPYIHYCQGMNYIGVFILKYITDGNEEEAFWIFIQLLESFLSLEMYNNEEFFVYYFNMLEEYLKIEFSDLYEKLKKNHVQKLSFPFSELFTLFTNQIKPQITIQIWINLILQGQRALFKSVITFLNIFKTQLIQADDSGSIHQIIDQIKQYDNEIEFQNEYDKCYINKRAFMIALNTYSEVQRLEINGNKKSQLGFSQINEQCDLKSPICIHVQQTIKNLKRSFSYFIYKTANNIQVTDSDYFSAAKSQADFNYHHNQVRRNQLILQNQGQQDQQMQQQMAQQQAVKYIQGQADFEQQIIIDDLDDLLVGRYYHMCQVIDYRQNSSILRPSLSPKNKEKSQFRSPQFLSLKKVNLIESESQINLQQESSLDVGTDPFPVFQQTSSIIINPHREKSKTHSSVSNGEPNQQQQRKKEFTLYHQNYISYHQNEDELDGNEEEEEDKDGDFTYMFSKNQQQKDQSPKRRKSITLHDEGQIKQSQVVEQIDQNINEQFNQYETGIIQQNQEQDQPDNSPLQVRERSTFILLKKDKNDKFTIQLPAYTQNCIKVVNNGVEQKILKY
ncbi:rab-GTPase-TBC domain protein (macronuclear) [Tetrahymena thermophila SB210]|uniref:Rab-GTPase-TBC domain protein n=1 Tax=Tetrahymena thermophila (strain SB210) TaxID=312017 RepID=Q24HM9_TETTS|nr:rab-GTPase-TBC domain protein [Tetrahymena thermophila SB210]EAS07282.2 rab-GTPase-TBC domain protein [Tetrahymena thermophila SB210]|eukprot:XP_001027524.2 rab-GTPase-TBC domain protein [Tetrahymena thermophila SB210]